MTQKSTEDMIKYWESRERDAQNDLDTAKRRLHELKIRKPVSVEELKYAFSNSSDCYADSEDTIPAMTQERFVEVVTFLMGVRQMPDALEPEATDKPTPKPEIVPPNNNTPVRVTFSDGRQFKGFYHSGRARWYIFRDGTKDYDAIHPSDIVARWEPIVDTPEPEVVPCDLNPASEPPDDERYVNVTMQNGNQYGAYYFRNTNNELDDDGVPYIDEYRVYYDEIDEPLRHGDVITGWKEIE